MKIGIQIVHEGMSYRQVESIAHFAESLRFDCIWLGDHFWWSSPDKPMLETWTLMSYLLSRTHKIKIGSLVLNNLFRNPAILSHMISSIQQISDGRFNFGIGAGWHKKEVNGYEPYIVWKDAYERIVKLDMDLHFLKVFLKDEMPPIWIGGFGDVMLKVVAKHANASNFERFDLTPAKCKERLDYLEKYRKQWKNDGLEEKSICLNVAFEDINEKQGSVRNLLTKDYAKLAFRNPSMIVGYVKKRLGFGSPTTIIGDAETILRRLRAYADVGITYFVIRYIDDNNLQRLATEVYPEVRKW